jgi:5'-methylthioadenosine phosphorylase
LQQNSALAQQIVRAVVPLIGDGFDSAAHHALATAIITDRAAIPDAARARLALIAGAYL